MKFEAARFLFVSAMLVAVQAMAQDVPAAYKLNQLPISAFHAGMNFYFPPQAQLLATNSPVAGFSTHDHCRFYNTPNHVVHYSELSAHSFVVTNKTSSPVPRPISDTDWCHMLTLQRDDGKIYYYILQPNAFDIANNEALAQSLQSIVIPYAIYSGDLLLYNKDTANFYSRFLVEKNGKMKKYQKVHIAGFELGASPAAPVRVVYWVDDSTKKKSIDLIISGTNVLPANIPGHLFSDYFQLQDERIVFNNKVGNGYSVSNQVWDAICQGQPKLIANMSEEEIEEAIGRPKTDPVDGFQVTVGKQVNNRTMTYEDRVLALMEDETGKLRLAEVKPVTKPK